MYTPYMNDKPQEYFETDFLKYWQNQMKKIIGYRVSCGERPYPYAYRKSEGKVVSIEFQPQSRSCVFVTDKGERILSGDYDLNSGINDEGRYI